jgi:Dipeptidyl aminopeptidases/acylaminoacyl-peptidases
MRTCIICLAVVYLPELLVSTSAAEDAPYSQQENVVFGEVHGVGLLMDVFTPKGDKNGLGIVDVISGAWHSDRGKIRDHARAQTFEILCRKGYTVFAIRPGSVTKFSAPEMLSNLNEGIRWVKEHSKSYGVDADRLGLMGASAGGHLACLAAVSAKKPDETAGPSTKNGGTRVRAVAVFFPPTDFLNYGGKPFDASSDDRLSQLIRRLARSPEPAVETAEQMTERVTQISPARLVTPEAPPFLLIHGDADTVVPLQQSEVMLAALKKAGVPAELIVKAGGGHPWLTLHEEVQVVADWFDRHLVATP